MIDAHCHLDLYPDPKRILELCERTGVTILAMTNLPSHFQMGYPHVRSYKRVRLALGMHPLYASAFKEEFPLFLSNLHRTSYIGEIGLDFSREGYTSKDIQLFYLKKILTAISGLPKILSIHSRRAEKQIFEQLLNYNIRSAVFHWYSGPVSLIEVICAKGYYFSVNPAMLQSENGRKIISKILRSQILTESDGPFIKVEGRAILPSDTVLVIAYLAKLWDLPLGETSEIVSANFKALISGLSI
jgi:TatD DNase family protein